MTDEDTLNSRTYSREVDSIAKGAMEQDEDNRQEWIDEFVDSHNWVIYTHKARTVLALSRSEDAVFEHDADALKGVVSMSEVYTRAAFFAMRQDVMDEVARLEAEKEEE